MKPETINRRIEKHLSDVRGNLLPKYELPLQWLKKARKTDKIMLTNSYNKERPSTDRTEYYLEMLRALGISHEYGNDTKNKKLVGRYVRITQQGYLQIKEWQKSFSEQ